MTISIVTCPKCGAFVLNDTPSCYACHHVFDGAMAIRGAVTLPTDAAVAEDLEVCRSCGETYRKGLVRCWNCGNFTRSEIADAYEQMVASHRGNLPQLVELQEIAQPVAMYTEEDRLMLRMSRQIAESSGGGDDEGFEMSATDADFDFELDESVQWGEASQDAEPAVYSFAVPEPTPEPAPERKDEPSSSATDEIPRLAADVTAASAADAPGEIPAIPVAPNGAPSEVASTPNTAVPHSEATAGDVLLDIAKNEEAEIEKTKRQYRDKLRGSFLIYCPMGCRIRVQEKHRGKSGHCPRCHSVFIVPIKRKDKVKAGADAAGGVAGTPATVQSKWRGGLNDIHLHAVVPQKLRIKADSLLNDFTEVDLLFSDEGLLLVTLVKVAGFMGANLKKKPQLRLAVEEHLRTVGKIDGLPAVGQRLIPREALGQISIVQPSPPDVESLFGNIPVFGAARIAVKLPKIADDPATPYLSFSLSQFRQFATQLEAFGGIAGFGSNTETPLVETYNTLKCHYFESPVRELLGLPYYQKDPGLKLKVTGWRCAGCGLVICEDARKKEKIGGLNGKAIASAKCPKCKAKFGSNPLYEVEAVTPATPAAAPEPVAAAT